MIDGTPIARPTYLALGVVGDLAARERVAQQLAAHGIDYRTEPTDRGGHRLVVEGSAITAARELFAQERDA